LELHWVDSGAITKEHPRKKKDFEISPCSVAVVPLMVWK
jgi:hypothetical protein